MLVWSPQGVVVRASLACDMQESNIVLTGNRFAHVCFQSGELRRHGNVEAAAQAHVALRAPASGQSRSPRAAG